MIWIAAMLALYVAVLVTAGFASLRPYRIPAWISLGSLGKPMEAVELVTADGVLIRGSWTPTPGSTKIAVLLHGYMMNRSELVPEANLLCDRGFSCLLIDFRAHGKSAFAPSGIGTRETPEVIAAVEFARARQPNSQLLLMGSSMGAAAAVFALSAHPALADALVVDSAYARLDRAMSGWWRFLIGPFAPILYPTVWMSRPLLKLNPAKVDVAQALSRIGPKPILFFHNRKDSLVSSNEAQRNFEAAAGPKRIIWFENTNHCEGRWVEPETYHRELGAWLSQLGF